MKLKDFLREFEDSAAISSANVASYAGKTINHLISRPEFQRVTAGNPKLKQDLQDAWEGDARHPNEPTLFDKMIDKHAQENRYDQKKQKDLQALKTLHQSSFGGQKNPDRSNQSDKWGNAPTRRQQMESSGNILDITCVKPPTIFEASRVTVFKKNSDIQGTQNFGVPHSGPALMSHVGGKNNDQITVTLGIDPDGEIAPHGWIVVYSHNEDTDEEFTAPTKYPDTPVGYKAAKLAFDKLAQSTVPQALAGKN